MQSEPVTEREAKKLVNEWFQNGKFFWDTSEATTFLSTSFNQAKSLMQELARLCIAETIRLRDDEYELDERLSYAYDILANIWYLTALDISKDHSSKKEDSPQEERQKLGSGKRHLWLRHNPLLSFSDGFESDHYVALDKTELASIIVDYLARPWLRHPILDWILLDITITNELCAYGEALKQRFLPGPGGYMPMSSIRLSEIGSFNAHYCDAKGNLSAMQKMYLKKLPKALLLKIFWIFMLPIAAIWAAFDYHYEALAGWMLGIYIVLWVVVLMIKIVKIIGAVIKKSFGNNDPKLMPMPLKLWGDMLQVWKLLEGPIVNPTMVREAMRKSADDGAVWDTASWSIIDRVIAIDPAVWIVTRHS
jgi:hypothetical protein